MTYQITIADQTITCRPEDVTVGTIVRSRLFQSPALAVQGQAWHDYTGVVESIEVDGEGSDAFIAFGIRTESGLQFSDHFVDGRTNASAIEIL